MSYIEGETADLNIELLPEMSKKKKNPIKKAISQEVKKQAQTEQKTEKGFFRFRTQAILLALICFIFYANSFKNLYALDDDLVINKNEYVQQGFAGIPEIMKTDAFDSYSKQMKGNAVLSGGRYRPLSIVTFAAEQQIFGKKLENEPVVQTTNEPIDAGLAHTRHIINVLLYIGCVIALFYFLHNIVFVAQPLIAFLAALFFAIHPIHTEVVANIKSRDEIMSLLFICLTLIYSWRYRVSDKTWHLFLATMFFFLALLSKEYAVSLIILIPMMFYLFKNYSLINSIKTALPYLAIFIIYVFIRFSFVPMKPDMENTEVMNDPYLYATVTQKIATIIATQFNYIKLLFFPHPLSSDYAYNQIPYTNFADPKVWLSFIVYGGCFVWMLLVLKKRNVLAFALAFLLLNWLLVSNLIFNIGATMGERLIFHSSVGFAIVLAYFLNLIYSKFSTPSKKSLGIALLLVLVAICGYATAQRNTDWKDNISLYSKDINTSPNSVSLNAGMGTNYAVLSDIPGNKDSSEPYLKKAIYYWSRALALHHKYVLCYVNRASAYMRFGKFDSAKNDLDSVAKYYSSFPTLHNMYANCYFRLGKSYAKNGDYLTAIDELYKATKETPQDPKIWFFIGDYYAAIKQFDKSLEALTKAEKFSPNDAPLEKYIDSIRYLSVNKN